MSVDFGTWVKQGPDGQITRTATTPAQAVKFQFDGWQRQEPLPPATVPAEVPQPPIQKGAGGPAPARTPSRTRTTTDTSPTE